MMWFKAKKSQICPTNLRSMINEKIISGKQLSSSPFSVVKSIVPLMIGFKSEPNQRKQGILTNYKAYQPCCCGSTKHFDRRFQLQKFYSDSSEHFQGYPMLARRKRSIQAEHQPNYT
jgi:hypothetical protein